jgi:hypothetical protein
MRCVSHESAEGDRRGRVTARPGDGQRDHCRDRNQERTTDDDVQCGAAKRPAGQDAQRQPGADQEQDEHLGDDEPVPAPISATWPGMFASA